MIVNAVIIIVKQTMNDRFTSEDRLTIKQLRNRSMLMLILLIGLSLALLHLYCNCADAMHYEYNEYYGNIMYSETNFTSMEFLSGVALTIVLSTGYLIFRKSRLWKFHCTFWFIILCVVDYFISKQFPIYNFQESTAISSAFDREISPILVVLGGVGYALPFSLSLFLTSKIKGNSRIVDIILQAFVIYFGIGCSFMMNMAVYIIGLSCGL